MALFDSFNTATEETPPPRQSTLTMAEPQYAENTTSSPNTRQQDLTALARAIYKNESDEGRDVSTSSAGARGPMQIMPGTFKQYARPGEDIDNPRDNVAVGGRIIEDLYNRFGGDPQKVLIGYNAGPGNANMPFGALPGETQRYIQKAGAQNVTVPGPGGQAQPSDWDKLLEGYATSGASQPTAGPAQQTPQGPERPPAVIGSNPPLLPSAETTPENEWNRMLLDYDRKAHNTLAEDMQAWYKGAGAGALRGLASTLGTGGDLQELTERGANALGLKPAFSPIQKLQRLPRTGEIIGGMERQGWDATIPETSPAGYFMGKATEFAIPSMLFGIGGTARTAAQQGVKAGAKALLGEGEQGAMAGLGAGTGGEFYKNVAGEQNVTPQGEAAAEAIGGIGLSPRIPIAGQALPAITSFLKTPFRMASNAVRRALGKPEIIPQPAQTIEQAKQAATDALHGSLQNALDTAKEKFTFLAGPDMVNLDGSLNHSYLQNNYEKFAGTLKQEISKASTDARDRENQIWGMVNREEPRDYSATLNLLKSLKADYNKAPNELRRASGWPSDAEDLFQPKKTISSSGLTDASGQPLSGNYPGLQAQAPLQHGQDLRSQLLSMIREERAKPVPNQQRVGVLGKLQEQLLEDMGRRLDGTQDDTLNAALSYSRAMNQTFKDPRVLSVTAPNRQGADRMSDLDSLQKMLSGGQSGVDAVNALTDAAQFRYGGSGPEAMSQALKDAFKTEFVRAVGPNGYVNPSAADRWMQKYAPLLSRWPDVEKDLRSASNAERDVGSIIGSQERPPPDVVRNSRRDLYLQQPVDQSLSYVMGAKNQEQATRNVIKQLQDDPTGDALMGWKQLIGQKILDSGDPKKWIAGNQGIIQALDQAEPGFAKRVDEITNITSAPGKLGLVADLSARLLGSKLGNFAAGHATGSELVMASAGSRVARDLFSRLTGYDANRMTGAMIADPAYYDMFRQVMGGGKWDPAALTKFKGWMAAMGVPGMYGPEPPGYGEVGR